MQLLRLKAKKSGEEGAAAGNRSPLNKKKSTPYTVSVVLKEPKHMERSSSTKQIGRGVLSPELTSYATQSLRNKFAEVKWPA